MRLRIAVELIALIFASLLLLALHGYTLPRFRPLKPPGELTILISDNHGESFFFLAEQLDPRQDYTLVLIDEHNDASAVADSDEIRRALKTPAIFGVKKRLLSHLRQRSVIQCYNWIEPLMPRPIAKVVWVAQPEGEPAMLQDKHTAVRNFIDFFEATIPRATASLHERVTVIDRATLLRTDFGDERLLASIDLDYFRSVPAEKLEDEMNFIFGWVARQRQLFAFTLAVSRPYLNDEQQAKALLLGALEQLSTRRISSTLLLNEGPVAVDTSLKGREYAERGAVAPQFTFSATGPELQAALARFKVRFAETGGAGGQ